MKKITEMTHEEIVKLTEEDIQKMVRRAAAEEGVRFLDAPIPPERPNVAFDSTIYGFGDFHSYDMDFLRKLQSLIYEHVDKLRDLDYDWQIGSEYKSPKPLDGYRMERFARIETIRCVSQDLYLASKSKLQEHKKAMEQYEKDLKEWESNESHLDEIKSEIGTVWNNALRKESDIEKHKARFKEYRQLGCDEETSIKFYRKAYPVDSDTALRLWGIE